MCDANIKMDLPSWVMGGSNNSKWGDENNILHTPALSFVSVSLSYWMGESTMVKEGSQTDAKQQLGAGLIPQDFMSKLHGLGLGSLTFIAPHPCPLTWGSIEVWNLLSWGLAWQWGFSNIYSPSPHSVLVLHWECVFLYPLYFGT